MQPPPPSACMANGLFFTVIIVHFKALVDGPCSNVRRKVVNFKALQLTKFKIKVLRGQRTKNIKKAWEEAKINEEWEKTTWAKKLRQRSLVTHIRRWNSKNLTFKNACQGRQGVGFDGFFPLPAGDKWARAFNSINGVFETMWYKYEVTVTLGWFFSELR